MIVALMLVGLSSSADAHTMPLGDYKAAKNENEKNFIKNYLSGVIAGISAFYAEITVHGKQAPFCIPPNLALTTEQAEDIIMRDASRTGGPDDIDVATYLVDGLKDTFPCDEKH
jgi:hypothetical protein